MSSSLIATAWGASAWSGQGLRKIIFAWQENLSPLVISPIIKQGLVVHPARNRTLAGAEYAPTCVVVLDGHQLACVLRLGRNVSVNTTSAYTKRHRYEKMWRELSRSFDNSRHNYV